MKSVFAIITKLVASKKYFGISIFVIILAAMVSVILGLLN